MACAHVHSSPWRRRSRRLQHPLWPADTQPVKRHSDRLAMLAASLGSDWREWWAVPGWARLLSAADVCLASVFTVAALPTLLDPRLLAIFAALTLGGAFNVELGRLAEGGPVQTNRLRKGLSAW